MAVAVAVAVAVHVVNACAASGVAASGLTDRREARNLRVARPDQARQRKQDVRACVRASCDDTRHNLRRGEPRPSELGLTFSFSFLKVIVLFSTASSFDAGT